LNKSEEYNFYGDLTMKKVAGYLAVCGLIISSVFIVSCSDSERILGVTKQTSTVVINLNLPDKHAMVKRTVLDRIFRLFMRDAVAQTAPPAAISSITVRVTGQDISPLEYKFNATDSIAFNVPAGNLRQFEVIAHVDPADPSAILSLRGFSVANLPAGQTVYVPVVMILNETKLVIPDMGNNRLVVKGSINDSTWTPITTLPGFTGTFRPYDVDFDSVGRMYIANYGDTGIIRIDNTNGDNLIQSTASLFGNIPYIQTITVDRNNNRLYFATNSQIYRSDLDGLNFEPITLTTTFSNLRGIDVDTKGFVYMTGTTTSPEHIVIRYDPLNPFETVSFRNSTLSTPWDVLIRNKSIYVANSAGFDPDGNQILELEIDSSNVFTLKKVMEHIQLK